MTRPTPAAIRAAAEASAKYNVIVKLEGNTVTFLPKQPDNEDDFDLVRMKRK